ncbi:unnamed protein product [Linum tenue]|uniref:GTD-binding domain-containing protein n=1 Tax=Linum tenue TaxID=586396 RepID=A0AAV0JP39_9ROSI|nr:unnamed protein product [Linum tenue]
MAETHHHAMLLPETDAFSLREALHGQQQILQKLYRELDVEREAAATAASEAMSMILRLQGEKAALKMEASQYKRMAEEKMCHAEETLELCDDMMYQKEMEIASLEFQLQSYRNRLVSVGPNDAPELDLASHKSDTSFGEKGSGVRRLNSLPQLALLDFSQKKVGFDRKQLPSTSTATIDEEAEFQEIHELEKKLVGGHTAGDLNSYWEQIKKLDERLKEMSDGSSKDHTSKNKSAIWRGGTWSHSSYSQLTEGNNGNISGENSTSRDLEVGLSSLLHSNNGMDDNLESQKKRCELLRKGTSSGEQVKTELQCPSSNEKKKAPKDAPLVDHGGLPPSPASAHHPLVMPCDYQKLMRRIERLERGRNNVRQHQEIVSCGGGQTAEEEMHLLKAIQEQLSGIQTELKSRKAQKPIVPDEPCLDVLQEAMLYFWL